MFDPAKMTGQLTAASSVTSISLWGFNVSELGVIVSAVIALLTFAMHVWYTLRKNRREEELHRIRVMTEQLRATNKTPDPPA